MNENSVPQDVLNEDLQAKKNLQSKLVGYEPKKSQIFRWELIDKGTNN